MSLNIVDGRHLTRYDLSNQRFCEPVLKWWIILPKENILHTKRQYLMNNQKRIPSQEFYIPHFIDVFSDRNYSLFSLAPKVALNYKRMFLLLLLSLNKICQPAPRWFSETSLLF